MSIRPVETHQRQPRLFSDEPLGAEQCQLLGAALVGFVPHWLVELHYNEHGKASIVIMPEDRGDAIYPTFIVRTDGSAFHFDELRCDAYRKLAEHRVWADVLRAVQIRLMWEMPTPATFQ